jgi:hypothetical protein
MLTILSANIWPLLCKGKAFLRSIVYRGVCGGIQGGVRHRGPYARSVWARSGDRRRDYCRGSVDVPVLGLVWCMCTLVAYYGMGIAGTDGRGEGPRIV